MNYFGNSVQTYMTTDLLETRIRATFDTLLYVVWPWKYLWPKIMPITPVFPCQITIRQQLVCVFYLASMQRRTEIFRWAGISGSDHFGRSIRKPFVKSYRQLFKTLKNFLYFKIDIRLSKNTARIQVISISAKYVTDFLSVYVHSM